MNANMKILTFSIISILSLAGCNWNSSNTTETGNANSDSSTTLKGQFIDAPVEGLYYETSPSGKSGFTDADGMYDYEAGDSVTFFLGGSEGIRIGSASARDFISPFEATGNYRKAINLARILQSIDTTSSNDRIVLPDSIKNPGPATLAALYNLMLHDIDSNNDLKASLGISNWVSEEKALEHLNGSLANLKRGSKEKIANWNHSSNKYLRHVISNLSGQHTSEIRPKQFVHADKLLPEEIFNMTRGLPTQTFKLDPAGFVELAGSNDSTIQDDNAKVYLSCLEAGGTYTPESQGQCDNNAISPDDKFDLGAGFEYVLVAPNKFRSENEVHNWGSIKKYGPLYKCLAEDNCSESILTGFSKKAYDDSDSGVGSRMQEDVLSTSFDYITGVYTEVKQRTMLSGSSKGYKLEELNFVYMIDSPNSERYVDFIGTWKAIETYPGCGKVARSTYTFDEKGLSVEGEEFSGDCELTKIKEKLSYSELAEMDFWWFETNEAGKSKATLAQLNSTIRWCDTDGNDQDVHCDTNPSDIKFNRWQYMPVGKNWDEGVINRRTLDSQGEVVSTISIYK